MKFLTVASLLIASLAAAQATKAPLAAVPPPALPHLTLDRIHAANSLACGVAKEEEDYSRAEDHGNRAAFDIDLCKAVAVATLGPNARLVVKSFSDEPAAVKALLSGDVDLLPSTSLSVTNSAEGLVFSPPVFLDGQGLLLPNNSAITTPSALAGKKICFATASAAEDGLHSYAAQHGLTYVWYPFSEEGEMEAAFFTGNCDAITSDVSRLANMRAIDPHRAHDYTILPQLIRQDPLASATLGSDTRFAAIVYWTIEVLFAAEELGITQKNVHIQANNTRPEVQQLLGQRYGTGTALGIDPHWGANVIDAIGNYGEIFERDLGAGSELRLDRGENRLAAQGGVVLGVVPSVH